MASKRSQEIRAVKLALNEKGHEMGNVINVSPFAGEGRAEFTVHTTCRKCGRGVYIEKRAEWTPPVKYWGDAKQVNC